MHETIRNMPKVELHVHLDGSVAPQTLWDIAQEQGLALPVANVTDLDSYMKVDFNCPSLRDYLEPFGFVLRYLQTASALERVAYELVEQVARENVIYLEVRFAPRLHQQQGLTLDETIEAVAQGLQRGERDFGVVARIIVICMRHESREQNEPVVAAAIRQQAIGVVAVDLAGDEASFPPQLFRGLFAPALAAGLGVTIHAGEAGGAANVAEAIEQLGAQRVGHGIRSYEDEQLLQHLIDAHIPLEMCPISNLQTKAVASWEAYPIRNYLARGVRVTVNTDNRTVSDTTLTKEYVAVMEQCGLTLDDVKTTIRTALGVAFVDEQTKQKLQAKLV